jgi:Asp-tRNA(Asn)/Glu-tRNA(Gln) amidotransferase A subunit family amidase
MTPKLDQASVVEIAAAFARRETTPSAYLEQLLARIARHDGRLKSLTAIDADGARHAAERADRAFALHPRQAPLCGIPIIVKDVIAVRGLPWTAGMVSRASRIAPRDAACIRHLRKAGAIPIAGSAMTEAGFLGYRLHAAPLNPWDEGRWPGASSSGSAVAVAAGFAPASLGADTGGSIRFPAAACGLVGLKPTRGAVSLSGVDPTFPYLDTVGPIARTAEDAGLLIEAMSPRLSVASARADGSRIALLDPADIATQEVAAVLANTGALVTEVTLPDFAAALEGAAILFAARSARDWRESDRFDLLGAQLRGHIELGRTITEDQIVAARRRCADFTRRMRGLFDKIDFLVTPLFPGGLPKVSLAGDIVDLDLGAFLDMTLPVNVAGLPGLTLPAGLNGDDHPRAVQLVGPPWSDLQLCRVGDVYQRAAGARGRPTLPGSALR